ncbi:MAG TPA: IclR family transcriptional regulator [Anaerolineae bacterium]|nr:IclR family transcriptional regulator [Anaerolineae bacterium]
MPERGGPGVQSLERAIAILKAFSVAQPERGVGELSRELGLHKSTISRLMATLERGGLLDRDPHTQRYRLGVEILVLAAQVVGFLDVQGVARPFLKALSVEFRESVNLVVLDVPTPGSGQSVQVVNLEQFVPPARQVKDIGRVGRRMSSHATAAGKVLLASLPPDLLLEALPDHLRAFTPETITDRARLLEELAIVRQQGYGLALEELEEGLNAVAAPIYDHSGQVVAAASAAGPAYRVTLEMLPHLSDRLVEVAGEISQLLGYLKPEKYTQIAEE